MTASLSLLIDLKLITDDLVWCFYMVCVETAFQQPAATLTVVLFYSRNSWKGRARERRARERWVFFNNPLACPLCGLHCRITNSFHLSHSVFPSISTFHPPTRCQVLLWDTQWSVFMCTVEWGAGCPFARQQYTEAPLRKKDYYWTTEKHTLCKVLFLSHIFWVSKHIEAHRHVIYNRVHVYTHTNITTLQRRICKSPAVWLKV